MEPDKQTEEHRRRKVFLKINSLMKIRMKNLCSFYSIKVNTIFKINQCISLFLKVFSSCLFKKTFKIDDLTRKQNNGDSKITQKMPLFLKKIINRIAIQFRKLII